MVYLTEHGQRLAAIVPADLAAGLENQTPEAFRGLLEDFADAQAAREALAEIEGGPVRSRLSRSGRNWASIRDLPAVRVRVRSPGQPGDVGRSSAWRSCRTRPLLGLA